MAELADFKQSIKTAVTGVFNEQKAVLEAGIDSKELASRVETILQLLRENQSLYFTIEGEGTVTFQPRSLEAFLDAELDLLTMALFLKDMPNGSDTESVTSSVETAAINGFEVIKNGIDVSLLKEWISILTTALKSNSIACSNAATVLGQITGSKHAKVQLLLLALLVFTLNEVQTGDMNMNSLVEMYSREELFVVLGKILPRSYNANLYFIYVKPMLQDFLTKCISSSRESVQLLLATTEKRYAEPMKSNLFLTRYTSVLYDLNWATKSLESACEEIPIRATLSDDSPFELMERVVKLWYLLDTARIISIDDFALQIFVFSDDLIVYYTNLMRMFFILNRMREILDTDEIWDSVLGSENYSQFLESMVLVYTEMHSRFTHLCRVLNRNYEIIEITSNVETGLVDKKSSSDPEILQKLREVCLNMTCPLALMDYRLRLKIYYDLAPVLFDEETERFIFSLPLRRVLPSLDFLSSDREYFAEHIADMYSCLDRHFCQFHPLKKSQIRYDDHALPPAYSNFAKTPPTYTMTYNSLRPNMQFNSAPGVSNAANNRSTVNPLEHMTLTNAEENPSEYKMSLKTKLIMAFVIIFIVILLSVVFSFST